MIKLVVSSKGQIVIPAKIRKALRLERATRLELTVKNDTIMLKRSAEGWRSLRGSIAGESMTKWLEGEHQKERERDAKRRV